MVCTQAKALIKSKFLESIRKFITMKKILYVTDTLSSGGIESQLVTLITGLDKSRFEPHVVCLYGEKAGYSLHFAHVLQASGIPVTILDIELSKAGKLKAVIEIIKHIYRISVDVLQPMNYHSNLLCRIARPFLLRKLKLIGTMRNDYSVHQLRLQRYSAWLCDLIVCNSPHLKHSLIHDAHIPENKIRVVLNGVDVARFRRQPTHDLRPQIASDVQTLILMVSRITRQKSPHLLVEALGRLKQTNRLPDKTYCVIVGERHNHPSHDVQHLLDAAIAQYDLGDVVKQHPHTNQPEHYYHAADVTVLASLYEGLPNVVLESLAVGRPVIVSEAANRAQVIQHGKTGWIVRTEDVQHLADTLEESFKLSSEQRQNMRQNCLQAAEQFSIEKMVHHYENLYG
jgi:glycosyltransferase involved in cell wall biosynthesis